MSTTTLLPHDFVKTMRSRSFNYPCKSAISPAMDSGLRVEKISLQKYTRASQCISLVFQVRCNTRAMLISLYRYSISIQYNILTAAVSYESVYVYLISKRYPNVTYTREKNKNIGLTALSFQVCNSFVRICLLVYWRYDENTENIPSKNTTKYLKQQFTLQEKGFQ